jgi:xanthine/uracil permease
MDPDLFMVIGLSLGVLAMSSMISSFSEGRAPRAAFVVALIAGTLVILALNAKGGYSIAEVMQAFYTVIGRYLR